VKELTALSHTDAKVKQPMRANFERYVDQITQNVTALLKSKLSVNENRKIASRCRIASGVSGP
jgi:hypothetical protein